MQSMTGFGHAERVTERFQLVVDLRTVNGRYFDLKARIPRELISVENTIKSVIQQRLPRGRVDLFLELRPTGSGVAAVNVAVVEQYLNAVNQLRSMGIDGSPTVSEILALPGVLSANPGAEVDEATRELVLEAVREATDRVWDSRRAEGLVLAADLRTHLQVLSAKTGEIAEGAATVRGHYQKKFEQVIDAWNLRELADESRLVQEIALYVERSDITEEVTRLRSHLAKFEALLVAAGDSAVGRDLDFLCQEMNREVNTILAKSVLVEVTEAAVEAKATIERVREQAQNVE